MTLRYVRFHNLEKVMSHLEYIFLKGLGELLYYAPINLTSEVMVKFLQRNKSISMTSRKNEKL